ncbi:GDSL-type esterase/lipase family protein [Halodesulfovibrio marinisediminis]|uniref:Lysophospholipase L1 n=1 Tax=Halodesulfovibrio marinisediminis DSM 17456 TaxID=1121457 RepID=A0A1N6H794_9BACT|nr:GDSL-type esterase/lipase family protein [Halodesulfovibrio marinisediminis]SIO15565.1 Lysophospholipase L1 [Halodesulfovibrio marinisediminis DSM 17456]
MKTFFFFGDSLTLGVNDPSLRGWIGQLSLVSGVPVPPATFYNLGARKHSSAAISKRWKSEVEARLIPESKPRLLFTFGVVDMATTPSGQQNISTEESVENARAILVDAVETYGKKNVVMVSPFPVVNIEHRERIGELSAAYLDMCADYDIAYVDIYSKLAQHEPYLNNLSDGVHPSEEGHAIIADLLHQNEHILLWMNNS